MTFRSIHLSNVAVQENYLNGKRSEKIPDNNFMTSDQLKEYLWYVDDIAVIDWLIDWSIDWLADWLAGCG